LSQLVYSPRGGALRTIVKDIFTSIDAEIARLEQMG